MLLPFINATVNLFIIMIVLIIIAFINTPVFLLRTLIKHNGTFFTANASYSEDVTPRIIGAVYPPGFLTSNAHLCPGKGTNISLLIAVFSTPSLWMSRNIIRKTWGQYTRRHDVSVVFFIGFTTNEVTTKYLEVEQECYADIVQGRFSDSYHNLTYKTLSILEWVEGFCPKADFLLKTDDDVFVHVENTLKLISALDRNARRIYGSIVKKLEPYRDMKIKYFISKKQYKLGRFPDFTGGPGYLIPVRLVPELYSAALNFPFLKVEDVLFTGIIARFLGIKLVHMSNFHSSRISLSNYDIRKAINVHSVSRSEQLLMWRMIHSREVNRLEFEQTIFFSIKDMN
ncbi:beta-1,3-galactosyltransferase 5-like [Coccinella septempunctata]|uniref:beta-1,3-galactosyltransferase 5-like n=1 Tax=Coccinella septempunctata TaxID=41139 RepID=UPI001D092A3B|nr:beta-1,3-galactosyltransferase 5-like [Coccinella septempunctata]